MAIEQHQIKVSATGSAGVAPGSTILPVALSRFVAAYIDYHASAPGTTDVTISSPGNPASQTILAVSNTATDAWYYPVVNGVDNAGAAEADAWEPYVVHGNIQVDVAQGDALTDIVTVTVFVAVP